MYLAIARRYASHPDDWPFAPRFDPLRRWYHRLAEEPGAEVWLLTWLPGQETDLHDHGGSAGAFVVVQGQLVEHTIDADARLHPTTLVAGAGRSFGHAHGMLPRIH